MSGADATGLPGDAGPGRRAALLIAVETYADQSLAELRAPADDAAAFRDVLSDSALGGFEVTSVIDADAQQIRLAVDEFLTACKPEDLALVYLSCHGLMDARRRLYFAATDTLKDRLAPTGVGGDWLLDQLEECRARRQVVILDCCFSGAFGAGRRGAEDSRLGDRFVGQGRGRVVLTASRATEYSFFRGIAHQGFGSPQLRFYRRTGFGHPVRCLLTPTTTDTCRWTTRTHSRSTS